MSILRTIANRVLQRKRIFNPLRALAARQLTTSNYRQAVYNIRKRTAIKQALHTKRTSLAKVKVVPFHLDKQRAKPTKKLTKRIPGTKNRTPAYPG